MCSRCNVEDSALISYVINGINDSVFKKLAYFLYSSNIYEFKQKVNIYEILRLDCENVKPEVDVRPKLKPEVELKNEPRHVKPDIRYDNCGDKNHKSINCRNRENFYLFFF